MFTSILSLAAFVASASAVVYQGFNYGPTNTDSSAVVESDFEDLFTTAQTLVGISGFTSARLYTMIQAGTTNTPTEAIPAAITTKTTLLLGLWASAGSTIIDNEIAALTAAIQQYGTNFTDLIAGISIGSEDLYRNSPIGIENLSGVGAQPADIVSYISQVRSAIANTPASGAPIGHVDTWTAWVNGSNDAVISAVDWLGVDAYPYFQNTVSNAIDSGYTVFFEAYNATVGVAGGKPVWVTETGWAVSGPTMNLAVASIPNAQTYWDQVGCALFGKINTWWFTLRDSYPTTPSPSFGIVGSTLSTTALFNLTCPVIVQDKADSSSSSSASSSSGFSVGATASAASASASTTAKSAGAVIKPVSIFAVGVVVIAALLL
jgi:glucan endo-1,3-beta-D-glucosidase